VTAANEVGVWCIVCARSIIKVVYWIRGGGDEALALSNKIADSA
jgi:hypothetical protein